MGGNEARARPGATIERRERPARGCTVASGPSTERTRLAAGCGGHPVSCGGLARDGGMELRIGGRSSSGVGISGVGARPRVGRRRRPLSAASAMVAAPSTSSHTVGGPSARHVLALTAKQRETRHACIILQDLEWAGGRWGVSQRTNGLAAVLARSWKVRLQFLQWRRAAPECAGRVGTTPAKSCGKKRPPNRHDAGWRVAAARRAPLEGLPEGGPGDVRHVPTRCAARGRRRRARRRPAV